MRRKIFLGILAILLLTCLAYFPVLNGSAGFIWDDDGHVTNARAVQALQDTNGLVTIWTWGPRAIFNPAVQAGTQQYYPATFTSFWIEYHLWGLNPWGYHITNVLLHLGSALLLWLILRQLGLSPGVAWLAAALFAVHPVNVESVAWISERKNTLSMFFYLLAALCWIRWAALDQPAETARTRGGLWLFGAVLLFLLALLAKSVTVTLPVALLLVTWYKRGGWKKLKAREWLGLAPLFLVALLAGGVTAFIETSPRFIGAYGPDFNFSFAQRCIIAGHAALFYLGKLLWPAHLFFFYTRWHVSAADALQWLYPLAALALLALLFLLQKRIGRGPLLLALLFLLGIAPALGFINFYPMQFSFVADHFQYLGTLSICTAIALVLARLFGRSALPAAAGGILLVGLALLSMRQGRIYRNEETLYTDTLAANPNAWVAAENLAVLLVKQKGAASYDRVIKLYYTTIEKNPTDLKAFDALGGTLLVTHRYAEAEKIYRQAEKLKANEPSIENGLGNALLMQDKPDDAIPHYDIAVTCAPSNPNYLASYATALFEAKQYPEAERRARQAIALNTGDVASYEFLLGRILHQEGEMSGALKALDKSIRLNPRKPEPFIEAAEVFAAIQRDSDAIEYYQSALHLDPDNPVALKELARLLMVTDEPGRHDPLWAADLYRKAIPHAEGQDQILLRLEYAAALAEEKFYSQAADVLRQAIAIHAKPGLTISDREAILRQIQNYEIKASRAAE